VKTGIFKQLGAAALLVFLVDYAGAHPDIKVVGDPLVSQEVMAVRTAIAAATEAKDAAIKTTGIHHTQSLKAGTAYALRYVPTVHGLVSI
jgi:hypothetical protein